ncbi:abnormal spindle-like microcephaly-associated protein [Discoglossus pictus]
MLRFSPPARASQPCPAPPDSPPVLSLTHFSRTPFVNFGCVRPGAARVVQLQLHNPNQEHLIVQVTRVPENKGFSVRDPEISIEPFETVPVAITWTPLEEGGVRELLTFIVNNVVKHQAILLGRAELPPKKKKNLLNITKKKSAPGDPKLCRQKKKEPIIKTINKTYHLTQNNVGVKCERQRSPLHSCENHVLPKAKASPVWETKQSSENKAPTLQTSPLVNDNLDFTPGSLRRSKTYSVLCTTEGTDTTSRVQTDLHIDQEWTFNEQRLHNTLSVSPINLAHNSSHNVTCTPESTIFTALSPGEFYKEQLMIKTETQTHIDICTVETTPLYGSVQECLSVASFSTQSSNSRPASGLLTPHRTFLSPTSYLNNSCVPDEYLNSIQHTPILSPDQFVRENFLVAQSTSVREPSLPRPLQSSLNSSETPEPTLVKAETKPMQDRSSIVDQDVSDKSLEYVEPVTSRLTYCVKKNRLRLAQPLTQEVGNIKDSKKPPVLSATVTKIKAGDKTEINQRPQPKSRRCILNVESKSDSTVQSHVVFQDLPVITISDLPGSSFNGSKDAAIAKSSICGRKRRSEEMCGNINFKVTSKESVGSTEIIPGLLENLTPAKKTHLSKPIVTRHVGNQRPNPKKKFGVVSSGKTEHVISKAKLTTIKTSHTDTSGPPQLTCAATFKNSKRIVAVPQSQLTFIKTSKTVIPRHPMPFAAKNMFYDERWIAKQERGFTWWLNFILTPDDFAVKTDSMKVNAASLILGAENSHKVSVLKAPTKEEVSLKAYTARCRLNRLRRAACRLFTSESVVRAIRRLEVEIEARRLLVRKDRHLWKDIGERQKVLNWLLSYNPLWLRIGLETIFGELISLESNSDVTGLALFIANRLLWNPDIASEYRHPTVPNLYRDGHEEALSKFTLKKLFLLVFFLDHAKQARLIDHDPCLFCKDAEYKASKDLLLAFSRDFLSGEGDLSRHLGYLGLPVSHTQTTLDEFDFAVTNLAVDLQCGVRLVRTMELLTQNWSMSKKLRVPAISRLQKMHNVEVAFQVLKDRGVQLKDEQGNSKDIVDRHRERTLALLWKIVFSFQVDVLLNVDNLKEEITFLKQSYSTQKRLAALRSLSNPTISKRDSDHFAPENYSERVLLLKQWVNAVGAFYNTKVENFTVSFSDGRVFCYLISHYHPSYVPLDAVCQRTTQTIECSQNGTVGLNSSSDSDNSLDMWPGMCDQGVATSTLFKELLENERSNFQLVNTAVSDLGGIPAMIHHMDMSNTIPDEKIVITYLSFLCARLLDLRKETRAARVIQTAWRRYKLKVEERLVQTKRKAALIIQRALLRFLSQRLFFKRNLSAVVIQKHWRRCLAQKLVMELKAQRLKEIQDSAARKIQGLWRVYCARQYYCKLRCSVIILQARVRMRIAVCSYKRVLCATRTIQAHLRSWLLATNDRKRYLQQKSATKVIQSAFKRWKRKKVERETKAVLTIQRAYRKWRMCKLAAQTTAAIVIQSYYLMHKAKQNYLLTRHKIIIIQSWFRCKRDQRAFETKKRHVLTLQKYYKAYKQGRMAREHYQKVHLSAVSIQAAYRGWRDRRLYCQMKAACVIQSFWRMHQQRKKYNNLKQLIVLMQSYVRRNQQLRKYRNLKRATCVIQSRYKSYMSAKQAVQAYKKICRAASVLQSAFRKMQARRNELKCRSVIKIQSFYRTYVARKRFLALKAATIKIQSRIKMMHQRNRYCALKAAALLVQRRFQANQKMLQEKEAYKRLRVACVTLQAAVRGCKVRRQIKLWCNAAVVLQSSYRIKRQQMQYKMIYKAALCIQDHYRAHRERIYQRKKFLVMKQSVITLQAVYRGYCVRKVLANQHAAATCIQNAFRSHVARSRYEQIKESCVKIQRWYRLQKRVKRERQNFIASRGAIIVIQATYRGWRVRKQLQKQHRSATLIQSAFRKFAAQRKFSAMKRAALTIQQHYRAHRFGNHQRASYLTMKSAAIVLQAAYRGHMARKQIQILCKAASTIQSSYRSLKQRKQFLTLRAAALSFQRRFRAITCARLQRTEYNCLRNAAITVQSVYRGLRVRREIKHMYKSAVAIQAWFRMHRMRVKYQAIRVAAVTIQMHYRAILEGRKVRTHYLNLKTATCTIQAAWRGRKVRENIKTMHDAATLIQSQYRMLRQKQIYKKLKEMTRLMQLRYRASRERNKQMYQYRTIRSAAVCIQSAFHGMKTRQELKAKHQAASVIQRKFKSFLERNKFLALRKAVVLIQQRFRNIMYAKSQRQEYLDLKKAAVAIQAAYRGFKERRRIRHMHTSAMVIQAAFRKHKASVAYRAMKLASIIIQQQYRAYKMGSYEREMYLKKRHSAIVIQSAFRKWRVKEQLKKMQHAASKIQAIFRMNYYRYRYRKIQWAVFLIQQWFRANKQRDFEMLRYSIMKKSACCIQAYYRGWIVRKGQRQISDAAIVIQRQFRTFLIRKQYISLKGATVVIQRRYRSSILARFQSRQYQSLRKAAIYIQASFRGFKVRKELEWKHKMATKIQAAFRMHRAYTQYREMKMAARVIQGWYKLTAECRHSRETYLKLRQSTIVIQAAYRGTRARKNVKNMHSAATIIQSCYRMYCQKNYYKSLLGAVLTVQQRYRSQKARDSALQLYQNTRRATILLQAAFRGMTARQQVRRMHQAAVIIQRNFKCFIESKRYLELRMTAVCLQRRYRNSVVSKCQRQEYLSLRKAAICIQAAYKGFQEREKMKREQRAATRLQAVYRMHRVRVQYKAIRQAATLIQRWYRGYRIAKYEQERYLEMRKAAIVIQASYRGSKSRKVVRAMHNAATVIQSCFRMYKESKYYKKLCRAVRTAQQRFRANRARDKIQQQYTTVRKAALCIQSSFRAMKEAKVSRRNSAATVIQAAWKMHSNRGEFLKTKAAAVIIQATFRGHRTRKLCKVRQKSARLIQEWYRSCRLTREQRTEYQTTRRAVVTLQSVFRGKCARELARKEKAARKIQSFLCMAACRRKFMQIRTTVIQLQSYYRMCRSRRLYKMQQKAVLVLQRRYRSHMVMKRQRESYLEICNKIIRIQATVRGFCVRRRLWKMEQSATKIQATWRSFIQRKQFLQIKASVLIIQQQYHGHLLKKKQREEYLKLRSAATRIQATYRGLQARKVLRRERAACMIQRSYRSFRAQREYTQLLRTVRTVQRRIRAKQERARFLEVRMATVCIQRWWRETLLTRHFRQIFIQKRKAALKIQSVFRGHIVRSEILKKQQAARVIQSSYRGFKQRGHFLKVKAAVLIVQTRLRALREGRQTRLHYVQERSAVIRIQALARGWLLRNKIAQLNRERYLLRFTSIARSHLSAVIIQRRFRIYLALKRAQKQISHVIRIQRWLRARQQRRKFLAKRQKIISLQRAVRTWLQRRNQAACVIQKRVRDFLLRQRQAKVTCGIVKIQALWRGYTWRKTHDTKTIRGIRLRIQKVNRESKEHDKLYHRTAVALEYLLTYKHLSYILAALQHLEVATRLSSVCCESMAESQAVRTLFILIRSCNRSIPCMEVIKLAVQVLLNLSKYEKTTRAVYEVDCSVDVLLDLMQMYREKAGDKVSDKGGSIFTKSCCLLAILAQNTQRAREIRSIPKALDRISSIYKLTCRKHKMDAERNLYKQRMNAPIGGSSILQSTPVRTRVVSRILPDWILRKDNMKEIIDPLKAIRLVMETLGVPA